MKKNEYTTFGVMLDVSRNAVMKVDQVKRMIDCLAKMGYNAVELYSEDTYEIEGEPYFGCMRGRYTQAELKEIDAYAKQKGIELIPCIQTLAHFTNLVRHSVYNEIVDTDDILLIDEPKTYELIEKMFATLANCFTSRKVNIGMDEAERVGLGKYLHKHGYKNRFDLLIRHLNKVMEIAGKYGFKAHMWSDMFFKLVNNGQYIAEKPFPEKIKQMIPESVSLTYWDYYHQGRERYDSMIKAHQEICDDMWYAGGAWSWNGFSPMAEFTLRTMKPAMESVREHGVKNVLITMWGDNGKECSFFSLLHALYAVRQFADGNFDMEKIKKGFYLLFKISFDDMMLLDLPNKSSLTDTIEWQKNPCKALLYTDPFMGMYDKTVASHDPIPYAAYAEILKKAIKKAGKLSYIFESQYRLCEALAIKAELGVKLRRAYKGEDRKTLAVCEKDMGVLVKRLEKFHEAFSALWNTENKPQGWEVQDARLGGLMQRIKTCKARLKNYLSGKAPSIPELEEEVLQIADGQQIECNLHHRLVTFNSFVGV